MPELVLNGWFLDDGIVGGSRDEVIKVVRIILDEGPKRGLELSTELSVPGDSKCRVWCPPESCSQDDPLGLGILPVREDGFVHLGAPVGSGNFTHAAVKQRVEKVGALLEKLPDLEDPYSEFVLLRSCFSLLTKRSRLFLSDTSSMFVKSTENFPVAFEKKFQLRK